MKIAPDTFNQHLKLVRNVFRTLAAQAGIRVNPFADIPTMALQTEGRRELTPCELEKVIKEADSELKPLFAVGIYAGMRLGDVAMLQWSEVDFRRGVIEHMPMKTARREKLVTIPIHSVLESILQERKALKIRGGVFVFEEIAAMYERDPAALSKRIQQHFRNCGIVTSEESRNGERAKAVTRVGFHSLRHSFVSLCAANRVPQVAIMELVGHGSPAMTRLYSHAGEDQKIKAIGALPDYDFD